MNPTNPDPNGTAANPFRNRNTRRRRVPGLDALTGNHLTGEAVERHTPVSVPRTQSPETLLNQDVILPVTDSRGATVSMNVKVTPAVEAAIGALVESHRFPFASRQDFLRAAILRLLQDCAAVDGTAQTVLSVVQMQRRVQQEYVLEAEIEQLADAQATMIEDLLRRDEYAEAESLANEFADRISQLPASVHQRRAEKLYLERMVAALDRYQAEADRRRREAEFNRQYESGRNVSRSTLPLAVGGSTVTGTNPGRIIQGGRSGPPDPSPPLARSLRIGLGTGFTD